jgi:hypothetical protein
MFFENYIIKNKKLLSKNIEKKNINKKVSYNVKQKII